MEFTQTRTVRYDAILLFLSVITQAVYNELYIQAPDVDRSLIWGLEGLLFPVLAAYAGAAMIVSKRYALVFSAIAFSAIFNLLQVGIGATQFGPAGAAAAANADLGGLAGGIFAFSFYIYNAAKILLGLAALSLGMSKMKDGAKALGGLTALVGLVAFATNTLAVMFGRGEILPSPVAGGSGAAATALLAICLFSLRSDD